jgi:hypothetical protein
MPSLLHHNPSNPAQHTHITSLHKVCIVDNDTSLLSDAVLQMTNPDLRVDGYLSYTFTPQVVEIYLAYLFKVDPKRVQAFGVYHWPGAFFIADPPMNHCRPQQIGNGKYAWLLDYAIGRGGSVVPQQLWSPQGQGDWRRYVEQARLYIPVFFINADGSLGVPVSHAAAGQMSLRDAHEPAPLGDRTTTKIRISVRITAVDACTVYLHSRRSGRAILLPNSRYNSEIRPPHGTPSLSKGLSNMWEAGCGNFW